MPTDERRQWEKRVGAAIARTQHYLPVLKAKCLVIAEQAAQAHEGDSKGFMSRIPIGGPERVRKPLFINILVSSSNEALYEQDLIKKSDNH